MSHLQAEYASMRVKMGVTLRAHCAKDWQLKQTGSEIQTNSYELFEKHY